jgi:hypothetical protein
MVEYLHCRPRNPSNSRSKPAQIKNTAWRRLGLPVIHTPWIDPHLHGSTQWKEEEDEGITCCPSGSRRFERMEEAEAPSERKMEGGEAHRWFIPEGMARGGGDPRVPALARLHARAQLLELPLARQRLHAEKRRRNAFWRCREGARVCTPGAWMRRVSRQPIGRWLHPTGLAGPYTRNQTRP